MKKSQFETLIREVIRETIRKVDGKYVVYPEKGGKRLGTHSTKSAAEKQLTAIHLNKENFADGKVNEIGDLSQTPYKFTKLPSSKKSPYTYYKFITDSGTTYEVVFERDETEIATTYNMAFTAKGKDGGEFSASALTGENEPLKIMSTVVDITKKHIDKVDDADYINFQPTKGKQGEEGSPNTRAKLYKLIIKKNFPKVEVIADDDTVLVDLEGYYDMQENYADGKVAEVKQEATDSMAVIFDRNEYDLFLYDITAKQILGYINVYNNTVTGVAAKKGYGPLMYELGMAHVYPNALQSDRNGNTEPEAKAVWEKFIAGANPKIKAVKLSPSDKEYRTKYPNGNEIWDSDQFYNYKFYNPDTSTLRKLIINGNFLSLKEKDEIIKLGNDFYHSLVSEFSKVKENYADGKVKGKSRPGRVKKAGASCKGSVTDLRAKAKKYGGEKGKMYHWCANMKSGKK